MSELNAYLRRREVFVVVALLLTAAALWAFIELADEVIEGETAFIDEALLMTLRDAANPTQPVGPEWLRETMRDFTALGSFGVLTLATMMAAGYLIVVAKRRAAIAVVLAVAAGVIISTALKMAIDRPRPELLPDTLHVTTASFPSGHSMMSGVVYLTLAVMIARVRSGWRTRSYIVACAVLITILVGVTRVYLGVHWPTDVLAGWILGSGWAMLCWVAMLWLQRNGEVEQEGSASESGSHVALDRQ